jgi:hypothetical protein
MPHESSPGILSLIRSSASKEVLSGDERRKEMLSRRSTLALLICFLAGIAATAILLYSLL